MDQTYLIAMNIKANVWKMQAELGWDDTPATRLVAMKKLFDIAQSVDRVPEAFMGHYFQVLAVMVEEQIALIAAQN